MKISEFLARLEDAMSEAGVDGDGAVIMANAQSDDDYSPNMAVVVFEDVHGDPVLVIGPGTRDEVCNANH